LLIIYQVIPVSLLRDGEVTFYGFWVKLPLPLV